MMKKILAAIVITSLFFIPASAQTVSRISLTESGSVEKISFGLNENVLLNLSKDGKIIDWGIDRYAGRAIETHPGLLDPYEGRVEYYNENENEAFRGKVKFIGSTQIKYFSSTDREELVGKVKSIGPSHIEYYTSYDNEAFRGNIKKAGQTSFTYYNSFDNDAFKGKLKSVGSSQFTYYTNTDDEAYKGKIKNIGGVSFTYFSSHDRKEFRGRMKTGAQLQYINGIKYHIKF